MMSDLPLDGHLSYRGSTVRYGTLGEGPPLLLVHGTPWSSFNLRHLINGLAGEHTVYFYDLLGYGRSDKPEGDVSLGVQDAVLASLLDHWGLDAPAAVGHDYGGATLLRTAILQRRRFSRLVLIDPVALAPWGSPFLLHVRKHIDAFVGLPAYLHDALLRAYIATAASTPLSQSALESTLEPWIGEEGQGAFYRQIAQADQRYTDEVEGRYGEIETETLILWGTEDQWIPVSQAEKLAARLPAARLELIKGAGHLVIEEQPEALLRGIREFLS